MLNNNKVYKIISISDIHFGCSEPPEFIYNTLKEQFLDKINMIDFDIVAICGDIFDSKFMSNNPTITYALQFINDLVQICYNKNASLLIIAGTQSHDSGQLSLFYHYMNNTLLDVRIIENIRFELVKGLNILCIPELYGITQDVYENVLYHSQLYDICLLHGTYKDSYKGSEVATLNSNKAPVFGMNHFINCKGVILMGHYHTPGCYDTYAYYNGCPIRYKFGEEETKGFMITIYNPDTRQHYTELIPIQSHIYATINIDHLINEDPRNIIQWIKDKKFNDGIDFIRVQFNNNTDNMTVVRNYFKNNSHIKFQEIDKKKKEFERINQEILETNQQYSFILDPNINEYDKITKYINKNEGYDFITSDELIKLLEGDN